MTNLMKCIASQVRQFLFFKENRPVSMVTSSVYCTDHDVTVENLGSYVTRKGELDREVSFGIPESDESEEIDRGV